MHSLIQASEDTSATRWICDTGTCDGSFPNLLKSVNLRFRKTMTEGLAVVRSSD